VEATAQQVNQIASVTAPRVEDSWTVIEAAAEQLIEHVDVDVAAEVTQIVHGYGWTVTFLMIGGVTGLLISPPSPTVTGVFAIASTASRPDVTRAKIT